MFRHKSKILLSFCLILFFSIPVTQVFAKKDYKIGVIFLDGVGDPITTALDLRVSLWDIYDVRDEDIDVNGDINESARHYGDYQYTGTITPDGDGYFVPTYYGYYKFNTANLPGFPHINLNNYFLQLEYKNEGDPNTNYQVYDFVNDQPHNKISRNKLLDVVAYITADSGPRTAYNTFTLDADDSSATKIKLEFGEILEKFLQWSITNTRFELNDSLRVEGNLGAVGEIYLADDHSATDSDGVLNFGKNNSAWESFKWNDTSDQFELSDDLSITGGLTVSDNIDMNLNELINFRIENTASPSTCDANAKGQLAYSTLNDRLYYCNGTSWTQL